LEGERGQIAFVIGEFITDLIPVGRNLGNLRKIS